MIRKIDESDALSLLKKYKPKQVCTSSSDLWLGVFVDDELVGCIGYKKLSSRSNRVKSYFVHPNHRKVGLGKALLDEILKLSPNGRWSAFATQYSVNLFKLTGFNEQRYNSKNDITFLVKDGLDE